MIFIAASMSLALRSGILVSAISRTCARVIDPATLGALPEPFSMPAAFRIRREAGGVLRVKSKLRSS